MRHSTGHKLEIAWSFATESIRAVEMFEYRLLNELPEDKFFKHKVFRDSVDFHCYLISLLRLKKAALLGFKSLTIKEPKDDLKFAIKEFETATPFLADLRNIGEHFDEYIESRGRNKLLKTGLLRVYKAGTSSKNSYVMQWMGYTVDTKNTTAVANKLYRNFIKNYKMEIKLNYSKSQISVKASS